MNLDLVQVSQTAKQIDYVFNLNNDIKQTRMSYSEYNRS